MEIKYDSPINIISDIAKQINEQYDNAIYSAVQNMGIDIDKDKLIQAIAADRRRYEKAYSEGYCKGYENGKKEIIYEIKRVLNEI